VPNFLAYRLNVSTLIIARQSSHSRNVDFWMIFRFTDFFLMMIR